jgi:hypothetical protein
LSRQKGKDGGAEFGGEGFEDVRVIAGAIIEALRGSKRIGSRVWRSRKAEDGKI